MDVGHFSGRGVLNFLPAILSQSRVNFPAAADTIIEMRKPKITCNQCVV